MAGLNDIINKLLGKRPEALEDRVTRLEELDKEEKTRTQVLQDRVNTRRRSEELKKSILSEREKQDRLYGDLGTDSPRVKKQKQTRMWIYLGIAIVVIFIITKGCF